MTDPAVGNLRVHLYGTQGSGSIFPSREERLAFRQQSEQDLLLQVFEDLARRVDTEGRIEGTIDDILGGPLNSRTLSRYAARFHVVEPRVYGGWTTCLRIETADDIDIVLDCGSGFRPCARDLQVKWGTRPSGTFTCLAATAISTTPKDSTRPLCASTRETTCSVRKPPVPSRPGLQPRDLLPPGGQHRAGRADADLFRRHARQVRREHDRRAAAGRRRCRALAQQRLARPRGAHPAWQDHDHAVSGLSPRAVPRLPHRARGPRVHLLHGSRAAPRRRPG